MNKSILFSVLLISIVFISVNGCNKTMEKPMEKNSESAKSINIKPRYARLYTEPGVEIKEANYKHNELDWNVPIDQVAIVAVDCWGWHFSSDTLQRIEKIMQENVAPLFAACRKSGLKIIHAPAQPVVEKYPDNLVNLQPKDKPQPKWADSPAWPPQDFRRKQGQYADLAKPVEPQAQLRSGPERMKKRDLHPLAMPTPDEPMIIDGEELHRYCAKNGIMHLIYIGFNTNACVMMRDYGIPAMTKYGYSCIILRDCTTGMEIADTVENLVCTKGTIADIEQFLGYSMTSEQLIEALQNAK